MIVEKVDSLGFHGDNKYYLYSDFNVNSFEELLLLGHIEKEKNPDWKGLEQDLRYSSIFEKGRLLSNQNSLVIFTTTLVNGKLGDATENALSYAFSILGVSWTEEEKLEINNILSKNNFKLRI